MTDTTATSADLSLCRCGERDLLTVKEVVALPIMRHVSLNHLYSMIERGEFPVRRISERKMLALVTQWCPVHERKSPDDIDRWLATTGFAA